MKAICGRKASADSKVDDAWQNVASQFFWWPTNLVLLGPGEHRFHSGPSGGSISVGWSDERRHHRKLCLRYRSSVDALDLARAHSHRMVLLEQSQRFSAPPTNRFMHRALADRLLLSH